MTQSLSQVVGQYMRQEQRLTPQLIQSMDILQLSMMALENRVAEELEQNIALELAEPERPERPEPSAKDVRDAASPEAKAEAESFNRLDTYAHEYDLDFYDGPYIPRRPAPVDDRDPKMDAMANTASTGAGG
jgi:RNA polymerase sigma-54 factor